MGDTLKKLDFLPLILQLEVKNVLRSSYTGHVCLWYDSHRLQSSIGVKRCAILASDPIVSGEN